MLLNDLEEYLARTHELENRAGNILQKTGSDGSHEKTESIAYNRSKLDSIISLRRTFLDSCSGSTGKTLWSQCKVNLRKADSLHSAGAFASEKKTLDIVELLFRKALEACGGK
jgi:hypothetical protein